jgi:hypothetical protein
MTRSEQRRHFAQLFAHLIVWAGQQGYTVAIGTTSRSLYEQRHLVTCGASRTLKNTHVDGLAGDLLLYRGRTSVTAAKEYVPLGAYWQSLDPCNVWGGSWETVVDADHFEYCPPGTQARWPMCGSLRSLRRLERASQQLPLLPPLGPRRRPVQERLAL